MTELSKKKSQYGHVQFPSATCEEWASELLTSSVFAHVESFNIFLKDILPKLANFVPDVYVTWYNQRVNAADGGGEDSLTARGPLVRMWVENITLGKPVRVDDTIQPMIYPSDCREGHHTYAAPCSAVICAQLVNENASPMKIETVLGHVPIMVGSRGCNLYGLSPTQLVARKEDPDERGGYFVINGNEKVCRLLIQPKTNHILAVTRGAFQNRGPLYSKFATQMRCMREDLTTQTISLHYRRDGTCWLRFSYMKNEYLLPMILVLHALHNCNDLFIFQQLVDGEPTESFVTERVVAMLDLHAHEYPHVTDQDSALVHLAEAFGVVLPEGRLTQTEVAGNARFSKRELGALLVRRMFFVHTESGWEKFQTLVLMFRKLVAMVSGKIRPDNPDALDAHDLLTPGQLYGGVLKESIHGIMERLAGALAKKSRQMVSRNDSVPPLTAQFIKMQLVSVSDLTRKMEYFMATGNLQSRTGLDLQQTSGFTIIADKLNAFRYMSHFRSVHRGAYFTEMKTTTVRKLLPETWGFLCPVHTPDGSPCGLLTHLAAQCRPVVKTVDRELVDQVKNALLRFGMISTEAVPLMRGVEVKRRVEEATEATAPVIAGSRYVWVTIDGRPVGRIIAPLLEQVTESLRQLKRSNGWQLEVASSLPGEAGGNLFPGLLIFTGPCRFTRPVICLEDGKEEWVGPLEQRNMSIAASEKDIKKVNAPEDGVNVPEQFPIQYTHKETSVTSFLSIIASLTPFSNHNQSPRNMYQCQMLKQTMAIPYLNHVHRTDNKVYRITYPQVPVIRTSMFNNTNFDTKPNGTNAIVAVISHSGYDMEDALIINKQSYERGFKHASVFKTKVIETMPDRMGSSKHRRIRLTNENEMDSSWRPVDGLQKDGLPPIGEQMSEGDALCCLFDTDANAKKIEKHKDGEQCWVEQVNLIGGGGIEEGQNGMSSTHVRVSMKLRIPRNPVVGDKFASRHGQKGVMAFLWPQEDMPFMASGFQPDILFNPHGFPSRMTIGMLIESIAGKAAVLKGQTTVDATTFREYPDGKKAHEYFGEQLRQCGYEYLGTEEMYSGVHGTMMTANIFVGVIYYQRLRHMVLDKAQVRATGPIDPLTKQPVKGRKRHGGIRFGEMERDSLLSHGVSFLLRDRLLRCSDAYSDSACKSCGTILSHIPNKDSNVKPKCISCGQDCVDVPIPFVFRYLCAELASMNIAVKLELEEGNPDSIDVL
jgi:DNA-directed RNA polymerase I subunit RPA2